MGKPKRGEVSKAALGMMIILLYILTIFLLPILAGAWRWCGLTNASLGYVFLGIGCVAVGVYFFTNAKKNPNRKFATFLLMIFCLINTVQLIFAIWFTTVWFA